MDILESLLNSSSHAIFALDHDGIVTHINSQAKERFGLFNHSSKPHAAGRLERGDLVILATTAMGVDDGGLQQEDLAVLGIRDKKLQPGETIDIMDYVDISTEATQEDFASANFADGFQIKFDADAAQTENILSSIDDREWYNAMKTFEALES